MVINYAWLGLVTDDKCKGTANVTRMYMKANQRLYIYTLPGTLYYVHVDNTMLTMFCSCIIQSVITLFVLLAGMVPSEPLIRRN